ncbi:hypothetical protein ACIA8O_06850 [Kitasatospora sp. NPDC051853]|uniref:hypothetical protein n=1 Tax=Kitasatospora sp. NPDC051853 TaxID=3364058 RepID=UPI0037BD1F7A
MSTEIVQLVEQAGPYLTAAVTSYGTAVLTRTEDSAVEATANLGHRILQSLFHRGSAASRATLETAVQDAAEDPADTDAAATLRQQLKRALREDPALRAELATLLGPAPTAAPVTITASGERSVAAHIISGTVSTGDTLRP